MGINKVLQKKDGSTLALGLVLAFVVQGALLPIADYFTRYVARSQKVNDYNPSFKDGVLLPLLTLVISVVLIEVWLWLADYFGKKK